MLQFPRLNPVSERTFSIAAFGGLNRRQGADSKTLRETENLSSGSLPVLATRKGRRRVFKAADGEIVTGIFAADKAYMTTSLGGRTRLYVGDSFDTLTHRFTAAEDEKITSLLCRYKRQICMFNLKTELGAESMLSAALTSLDYPARYKAPTFNDVTVYAHRIFGVRLHQIRACAYDDASDWEHDKEGAELTTRAFLQNFETKSDFTACVNYKNRAVFFTADEMFELYGKDSSQFDLVKVADIGCVSRQAVCEMDGVLYFISKEGVMKYSGAMPRRLSDPLDDKPVLCGGSYSACIGGVCGAVYARFTGSRGDLLYSYNVESDAWACEDAAGCVSMATYNGELYFSTDDAVYLAGAGGVSADCDSSSFPWTALTQKIHHYCPTKKRSPKLNLHMRRAFYGNVSVYASFDGGEFILLRQVPFEGEKTLCIPLENQEYDTLQVKICGSGEAEIDYISQSFSLGGRVQ